MSETAASTGKRRPIDLALLLRGPTGTETAGPDAAREATHPGGRRIYCGRPHHAAWNSSKPGPFVKVALHVLTSRITWRAPSSLFAAMET